MNDTIKPDTVTRDGALVPNPSLYAFRYCDDCGTYLGRPGLRCKSCQANKKCEDT